MLQFNKDKNRFLEMPAETYFHKNAPTAEIPEDTDLGHRVTAPTEEIPTDISPDSGDAMAPALGLIIDVDDDSDATS